MSGMKIRVATPIWGEEKHAIYTDCCGHALNLAVADTFKESKIVKDVLDMTFEMSKLARRFRIVMSNLMDCEGKQFQNCDGELHLFT